MTDPHRTDHRNTTAPTTIFFPGLGADSTLAKYHSVPGKSLWIEWPPVIPDNWDDFADLLARQIPSTEPLRFVGVSFGGLAALKTAQRLPPEGGVFLVGSLTGRAEIRWPLRALLPLVRWVPTPLFDLQHLPQWLVRHFFGIRESSHMKDFSAMASRLPPRSVKALCTLVAQWQPVCAPIAGRIHGKHDRIIHPAPLEVTMVDGGHLLSMTNAAEVNRWLNFPLESGH
ncbi:MAG: alpha/beta hydrolase [Fibrobacterota bacterium]|nr:MAG: alpha/beta hydrolase [Fibrobacterota bacterium]